MLCTNCGKELGPDYKFCSNCGMAVAAMFAPSRNGFGKTASKEELSKKFKVLVIDDDPVFLENYLFKFEKEGLNVILARNGREGLALALSEKPAAILLDVLMPGMNGLEVLKTLKDNPETKGIPVVMVTIADEKENIERGLALGADYYIIKTETTAEEVLRKVRKAAKSNGNGTKK